MFQEHESARLSVAPLEFVHFRALAMAPTSPLWQYRGFAGLVRRRATLSRAVRGFAEPVHRMNSSGQRPITMVTTFGG